jgi:hypothetical protein
MLMGFFDLLNKISSAVEVALKKVTPKGFRLSDDFVSNVRSKISQFAAGMRTQYTSFEIPFPRKVSLPKFFTAFKKELQKRDVKFNSGKNFIEFEKAKVAISRNKLTIKKIEKTISMKPRVAFIRLPVHEAKRYLKESFEVVIPRPSGGKELRTHKSRIAAFQLKYARHVMAASDGIKAGLRAINQNPESRNWNTKINKFLEGYCDYLLKKEKKDILPSSSFSLTMGSSADAKKFKSTFQKEVKTKVGKPNPAHVSVNIKGATKRLLVVATVVKKIQKTTLKGKKMARRVVR